MERKFFTNDFEQLLKENADQFKMSPSKKVWRGIYNDIHPGRKWPSVAMSLLFIFTLVLVGHLNTQQSQRHYVPGMNKTAKAQNPSGKSEDLHKMDISASSPSRSFLRQQTVTIKNIEIDAAPVNSTSEEKSKELLMASIYNITPTNQPDPALNTVADVDDKGLPAGNGSTDFERSTNIFKASIPDFSITSTGEINKENVLNIAGDVTNADDSKKQTANSITPSEAPNLIAAEAQMKKIPFLRKPKNPKINWTYYFGPALSYRRYSQNSENADQGLMAVNSSLSNGFNRGVIHRPSVGFDVGTAVKYSLTKKFKLTSGLQINYSKYAIQANNTHPIIATLVLFNEKTTMPYAISSISYFGNGPGTVPVNLHNYSLQVSLPVGFEYQLAGNDNVQLFASGSLQPTWVAGNRAYILSTDKRNYLTDPSLSRHLNMSTNIGTFVSFNSHNLNWQIGPQFRYQLLSSYGNQYRIKEHFIDYGIRFGVSKIIK